MLRRATKAVVLLCMILWLGGCIDGRGSKATPVSAEAPVEGIAKLPQERPPAIAPAVLQEPSPVVPSDLKARALEERQKLDEAERRARAAIARSPRDPAPYYELSLVYTHNADYRAGVAAFTEAITADPGCALGYAERALNLFRLGEVDRARDDTERALKLDPECARAHGLMAAMRSREGDIDGSLAAHNRAIGLAPNDSRLYVNRGHFYLAKYWKGREANRLPLNRGREPRDLVWTEVKRERHVDPVTGFVSESVSRTGRWQYEIDYEHAMANYDRAVELAPAAAFAYCARAEGHYKDHEEKSAIVDISEALRLAPYMVDTYLRRATIYTTHSVNAHDKRFLGKAMADCDAALQLRPGYAAAFIRRSGVHDMKGDREAALADLECALEVDPGNTSALYDRADIRERQGDLQGAVADYTRVAAASPDWYRVHYKLGRARAALGDHKGAVAALTRAVELKPRDDEIHFERGIAYRHLGDDRNAMADLTKSIILDPVPTRSLVERARIHYEHDRLKEALSDLKRALDVQSSHDWGRADAHTLRARVHLKQLNPELAVWDCAEAIKVDLQYAEAYLVRGLAHRALGKTEEARRDLKRAAELNADGDVGRRAKEGLEALGGGAH